MDGPVKLDVLMVDGKNVPLLSSGSLVRGRTAAGRTEWYVIATTTNAYAGAQGLRRVGLASPDRRQWWGEGIVEAKTAMDVKRGRVGSTIHIAGSGDLRAGYRLVLTGGPDADDDRTVLLPGEPPPVTIESEGGRYVFDGDVQDGDAAYRWEPSE